MVFLSYARKDGRDAALRLKSELESNRLVVWMDAERIEGGASWTREIAWRPTSTASTPPTIAPKPCCRRLEQKGNGETRPTGRRTGDPPRGHVPEVRLRIPQLGSRSGAPNFSIHDCG